ncbi:MAG: tRNA (N6-threonylcarbamoyladenosine(37)-N6)-methyltransferase TrmO [Coriobacteriia bacterium]|nr:tRNA (N6-threonylcarbamoyladenosine(37)-N6)-methyltransferase TrmO [Coriobacteriia bacterium]MBN2822309.1 tRNA (N6-threonylcarbamoyladenosine(37)-N6)-methyltransferase TrmO [Coriobacteriia bacterium]
MEFAAIGTIRSPFSSRTGMPIQPAAAVGMRGTVEVHDEYAEGLHDLDGFSHIILLYHFHRSEGFDLRVVPYLDSVAHGVFATRAPRRPNPLGMSVVRLERVEGSVLHITDVDVLDGTPLLDIKPYVPAFDSQGEIRVGWVEQHGGKVPATRSDDRFL